MDVYKLCLIIIECVPHSGLPVKAIIVDMLIKFEPHDLFVDRSDDNLLATDECT